MNTENSSQSVVKPAPPAPTPIAEINDDLPPAPPVPPPLVSERPQRRRRNSSKTNLVIALGFHLLVGGIGLYFAARNGLLGPQFHDIAVTLEKPALEKPKPPPEKPREEAPKAAEAHPVEQPREVARNAEPARVPPPTAAPAAVSMAPPAMELPAFSFSDGAAAPAASDPIEVFQHYAEYVLRSRWNRPAGVKDDDYVAEVEISIDPAGNISNPEWKRGSGNTRWDNSVRQTIADTRNVGKTPPPNFPGHVLLRFDVQDTTEPIIQ